MANEYNILDQGVTFSSPILEASSAAIEASVASIDTDFDVTLSTRASEVTLASVDSTLTSQLDVLLSTRASEVTLASVDSTLTSQLDVALSTVATEVTLNNIDTNFGAQADTSATTDTGTFSFMAFVKRMLTHLTDIKGNERNSAATVLTSAARTATTSSADQTNLSAQGGHVIINFTANAGAISVTPAIEAQDPASLTWYPILNGALVNSLGTVVLKVHPGLPGVNNKTADDGLPLVWRVTLTHGNANSVTYSVGMNYLE